MNLKLLVGVVLFVVGIVTAAMGIAGVGRVEGPNVAIQADQNEGAMDRAFGNVALPALAGLSLGVGGLLIGLSMGNWRHPRASHHRGDEVVNPEGYHKMRHV